MSEKKRGLQIGSHGIRYGIAADQKYLGGEYADKYDVLFLNATACIQTPDSLSSFLGGRLQNRKPFIVDPLTHAFQHSHESRLVKKGKDKKLGIKATLEKLATEYGGPALKIKRAGSVVPGDFAAALVRERFCRRVVEFQTGLFQKSARRSGMDEYFEYANLDSKIAPAGVVAPYFFLERTGFDAGLDSNRRFAEVTRGLVKGRSLYCQIVVTREVVLDQAMRAKLIATYGGVQAEMLLLWVDNWQEHALDEGSLAAYMELLKGLGQDKGVWVLYGSYFSVLLSKIRPGWKIRGVSHGPEYGEDRTVLPVGGGVPIAKYYFPPLHHRLRYEDAVRLAGSIGSFRSAGSFFSNVCGCEVCRSVIGSGDPDVRFGDFGETKEVTIRGGPDPIVRNFPTTKARDFSLRHYLNCKHAEYTDKRSPGELIAELEAAYEKHVRHDQELSEHLSRWSKALRSAPV